MSKPVVQFTGNVIFHPIYNTETGQAREYAEVYGVIDHPRLGFQRVIYTSVVEVKCEDGQSFETMNTIYKRAT